MDSQEVIEALASLRQNLEAIDSAKKQVEANVGAYETVRKQLADTAESVRTIINHIDSITETMDASTTSLSDRIEIESNEIIKGLRERAEGIDKETDSILWKVEEKLNEVKNQLSSSVTDSVSKVKEICGTSTESLQKAVEKADYKFSLQAEKTLQTITEMTERMKTELATISRTFNDGHRETLSSLTTTVEKHVESYKDLNASLGAQIQKLKSLHDEFSSKMDSLEALIKSTSKDLKESLESNADKCIKATQSSTGAINEVTTTSMTELRNDIEPMLSEIRQQGKTNRMILIVAVVLLIASIVINFVN